MKPPEVLTPEARYLAGAPTPINVICRTSNVATTFNVSKHKPDGTVAHVTRAEIYQLFKAKAAMLSTRNLHVDNPCLYNCSIDGQVVKVTDTMLVDATFVVGLSKSVILVVDGDLPASMASNGLR